MFEELFTLVRHLGASPFDCLMYVKENPQEYPPRVREIIAGFLEQTTKDLYDNFEEAKNHVLTREIIEKYVVLGRNRRNHRGQQYAARGRLRRLPGDEPPGGNLS